MAGQALQALLVGVVTIGTVVQAFVLPGIATGSTGDAVLLCGTVACGTRRVTIGASTKDLVYQSHVLPHLDFLLTCSPLSHTCSRDKPSSICSHAWPDDDHSWCSTRDDPGMRHSWVRRVRRFCSSYLEKWNKRLPNFLSRWSSYTSTYPQSSHRDRPADRRPDRWHANGRVHRWDNCLARRRRRFHTNHGTASKCPFDSGTIEADNDSRRCWIERERERDNDRMYMLSLSCCYLLIQSIVTARHTLRGSASIAARGIALGITGVQYQLVILIDQLLRLCCS